MPSLATLPLVFVVNPQLIVNEEAEEEQNRIDKEVRKKKRRQMCGQTWLTFIDPQSGGLRHALYECGLWREGCPICLAKRAKKYQDRIDKVLGRGDVVEYAFYSAQEASRLVAEEGKVKCLRFPQPDGTSLLFVANPSQPIGEILTDSSIINWQEICNTPKGTNVSGNLEKPVATKGESVMVEQIQHDATPEVEYQAWNSAKEETSDLNPKTAEEAQAAVGRRTLMFKKHLRRLGVTILFSTQKWMNVIVDMLDWLHGLPEP